MFHDVIFHPETLSTHHTKDLIIKDTFHPEKALLTKCFLTSHFILKIFTHHIKEFVIKDTFTQMFPDVIFHLEIFSTQHTSIWFLKTFLSNVSLCHISS